MTTEIDSPPEIYPWDKPEEWYARLQASLAVTETTPVALFDYPHPDLSGRVIGVTVGDITLHIGTLGGDAEIIAVIDQLIEPLQELRFNAKRRIADGPVPA